MKKNLKINHELSEKLEIIGIVSSEKVYKLSWLINNSLNLNLKKSNFEFQNQLREDINFVDIVNELYYYLDDFSFTKYILVKNKKVDSIIFSNYKNFDYLLIVSGTFENFYVTKLIENLRKIDSIIAVFLIEKVNKKNKEFIKSLLNIF